MSKCQQWISAWMSMMFVLLVMAIGSGHAGEQPALAASTFYEVNHSQTITFRVQQERVTAQQKPGSFDLQRYLYNQTGSDLADIRAENLQIAERKRMSRHLLQRHEVRMSYELASRDLELAEYAQFQKSQLGREVAVTAINFIGRPYRWGGTTPRGFDCSGFTQYVLATFGIKLPRNSYDQFEIGQAVRKDQLRPGDLVFFSTYAPGPSHLGIYIGNGNFVHALNHSTGVITSKLDSDYYKTHFVGARRVL